MKVLIGGEGHRSSEPVHSRAREPGRGIKKKFATEQFFLYKMNSFLL